MHDKNLDLWRILETAIKCRIIISYIALAISTGNIVFGREYA